MTTIPERIREEAREIARKVVFEADGELTPESLPISAHPIALALLAAEKRGREEAAGLIQSYCTSDSDLGAVLARAIRSTN